METAEARYAEGKRLFAAGGATEAAILELQEAVWLAKSIKYDALGAASVAELVVLYASTGHDDASGREWAAHASAAFKRTGPTRDEPAFRAAYSVLLDRNNQPAAAEQRARLAELTEGCRSTAE